MILDAYSLRKFFFHFFFLFLRKRVTLESQINQDDGDKAEKDRQDQVLKIQEIKKSHSCSCPLDSAQGEDQHQRENRNTHPQDGQENVYFWGEFRGVFHPGESFFLSKREIASPILIGELPVLQRPDESDHAGPKTDDNKKGPVKIIHVISLL